MRITWLYAWISNSWKFVSRYPWPYRSFLYLPRVNTYLRKLIRSRTKLPNIYIFSQRRPRPRFRPVGYLTCPAGLQRRTLLTVHISSFNQHTWSIAHLFLDIQTAGTLYQIRPSEYLQSPRSSMILCGGFRRVSMRWRIHVTTRTPAKCVLCVSNRPIVRPTSQDGTRVTTYIERVSIPWPSCGWGISA